jgi:hypothetical protein
MTVEELTFAALLFAFIIAGVAGYWLYDEKKFDDKYKKK